MDMWLGILSYRPIERPSMDIAGASMVGDNRCSEQALGWGKLKGVGLFGDFLYLER